jgi:hypothetical protein
LESGAIVCAMPDTDSDPSDIPWFDAPDFGTLIASENISSEFHQRVQAYARDGYVILDPEIADADALFARIIKALERRYKGRGRLQDAWEYNADVKALAVHGKVLSFLKELYRREPIPFQTLNFPRGTQQLAHSDTVHFSCIPEGFMCGVWIALEDVDESNGPLILYPGSQKWPVCDYQDLNLSVAPHLDLPSYKKYEAFQQELIRAKKAPGKKILLKKGQAVVWAANLLHGGSPILDKTRSRHSQVTHYYFDGCMYYTPKRSDFSRKKVHWRRICNIRTGQRVPHVYQGKPVTVKYLPSGFLYRAFIKLRRFLRF